MAVNAVSWRRRRGSQKSEIRDPKVRSHPYRACLRLNPLTHKQARHHASGCRSVLPALRCRTAVLPQPGRSTGALLAESQQICRDLLNQAATAPKPHSPAQTGQPVNARHSRPTSHCRRESDVSDLPGGALDQPITLGSGAFRAAARERDSVGGDKLGAEAGEPTEASSPWRLPTGPTQRGRC